MKNQIRKLNKERRNAMSENEVEAKSHLAAEVFLTSKIYEKCKNIMLYARLGNEIDTKDIIKAALADGKKVIFPVTEEKSGKIRTRPDIAIKDCGRVPRNLVVYTITPYYADSSTEFSEGVFSVSEPQNAIEAKAEDIDVVIVPGIAFDKSGARVGFGKGCYDMFLPKTNAIKIGYCYDFQIVPYIPSDKHDINMDYLLTESGLIKCQKSCLL